MTGADPRGAAATGTGRPAHPAVLYIAGPGRSGSTLLDLVLGQADGVVSIGELRNLWSRGLLGGWPCGCGEPVTECPFWSAVLTRAFGSLDAVEPATLRQLHERTVRTRHLPRLWWEAAHEPAPSTRRYAAVLDSLYRAVAEVSGAKVIVDSSKHPSDAILASTLADIDLFVLHLVRDPRAVAYSWSRPKVSEHESITLEAQSRFFSSVRWSVWNATIASVLARRVDGRYRLVRYEDLMADPARVLGDVLELVGLPRDAVAVSERTVTLGPTHSVSGNPARFSTGEVALAADERWRSEMGPGSRLVATLPALPVLRRFGYRALGTAPGATTGPA